MFAAFPNWYATLFSGFYIPLVFLLLALIGRGVAFEFRGKVGDVRWKRVWDGAIFRHCAHDGDLQERAVWGDSCFP